MLFKRFFAKWVWLVVLPLFMMGLVIVLNWLYPVQPLLDKVAFSKVFYDRQDRLLGARLSPDDKWRFETHLDQVSPSLIKALLRFEDQRFYEHHGVDAQAVARALWQNLLAGRIVSGASTLSMQVARLLSSERRYGSVWGKLVQVFRAIQLERALSKDEILQWYFNLAPYGGNIEGVVAASWLYFGKPPSNLSWMESIALAIAPKNPNDYRPNRFPPRAQQHCLDLTEKLLQDGDLSQEDRWFIECSHAPGGKFPLPNRVPHLIDRLATNSGNNTPLVIQGDVPGHSRWNHIRTTIDFELQYRVKSMLEGYRRALQERSINNISVMVVDNQNGEVLAYLGSDDFSDAAHQGQVDGNRAARSPGSTLKPFIYARVLESGRYNSHTLLANVPLSYAGYRPQNFDPLELGIVHLDKALQLSLNLPAVMLNVELEREHDLYATLKQSGVTTLTEGREHYGQALVLGGGEMRMDELMALYRALATGGKIRPVRLVMAKQRGHVELPEALEKPWISEAASYIVTQILSQALHPEYGFAAQYLNNMPPVAWKTGTSARRRDAWSLGYTPDYTIGVWVGNFDGSPVEEMTGANAAAPLFFEIARVLHANQGSTWPNPPENVLRESVCDLSGKLPTMLCPALTKAWWIAGVTQPEFDDMMVTLLIDRRTGERLSPACLDQLKLEPHLIERRVAVKWPRETGSWLARFESAEIFPAYKPGCEPEELFNGESPLLQNPLQGERYLVEAKGRQQPFAQFDKIAFAAAVSNEVNQLKWYLNGQKLASTRPGEPYLWTPKAGKHEVVVEDNYGRKSNAQFTVMVKD